jgi:iron complex outermembrane receptor protein
MTLDKKMRALRGVPGPTNHRSLLAGAVLSALLALGTGAAYAQQAQTPPTAQNNATGPGDLDAIPEITVTAQFRSQNLQDTPIAITAVTADMLRDRNQTDIAAVAERAPGVNLTTGGLGGAQTTTLSIRGIGQTDFDLGLEPGVGMYVDDVYYGTLFGSLFSLIDLDRVEILRGPQGTLSGKNSEGGALKLYSKQPTADTDGYLEGTFGNFNRREVRAGGNFTLVPDHLYVRLTGVGEHQDGYVRDYDYQCATGKPPVPYEAPGSLSISPNGIAPVGCELSTEGGKQIVGARAVIKYLITDDITDTFIYDDTIDHSDAPPFVLTSQGGYNGPPGSQPINGPGYLNPGAPPNDVAADFVPTQKNAYYNYSTSCGLVGTPYQYCLQPISDLENNGFSNNFVANLPAGLQLTSITAERYIYQKGASDQDGTPLSLLMNAWNLDYRQYSEELRLAGSVTDQIHWVVGAYYFRYNADQNARVSLDGAVNGLATFDFLEFDPVEDVSKSGFAHLEYQPIDALTFTTGVRYTKDFKSFTYGRALAPGYAGTFLDHSVLPINGITGIFSGARTDYSFTADYKIDRDVSVYFSTGTGYKGGGVDPRPFYALQAQPFKPETVTSYEVGLKTFLFDHTIRTNISAYYNFYKDIQLTLNQCPQFVPPGLPDQCALPANVGDAHVKGLEFETEAHFLGGGMFDLSADYIDFNYTSVEAATGITPNMSPPLVPAFKGAAGLQYKFDLGDRLGSITPRVDYQYIMRQQQRAQNLPQTWNPGYGLMNAHISWALPVKDTTVSLEGTNLLNKYYAIVSTYSYPPVSSYNYAGIDPGPPRMVAISVRKTF